MKHHKSIVGALFALGLAVPALSQALISPPWRMTEVEPGDTALEYSQDQNTQITWPDPFKRRPPPGNPQFR